MRLISFSPHAGTPDGAPRQPRPGLVVGDEVVDVVDATAFGMAKADSAVWASAVWANVALPPVCVGRCAAACAEAGWWLMDSVKIPVVIPAMTAMAVVSAMRIRTAPPFVGRAGAPGSARWGRAPAIAYAPRTESGKASSVLAWLPQGVRPVV